jgi:hypothetical protein
MNFPALAFCRQILSSASRLWVFSPRIFFNRRKRKIELRQSPLSQGRQCHYIQTTDVNVNGTIKTHLQVNLVPHQIETVMTARQPIVIVRVETDTIATRIDMEVEVVRHTEIVVAIEEAQVLPESLGNIHHHQKLRQLPLTPLLLQVLPEC